MEALKQEVKQLIVTSLNLEVGADEIDDAAPLFQSGLGLDSIDALELALAIQEKFGVATSPDDERNREIFFSVKTLAEFVRGATAASPAAASDPA